MTLPAPTPTTTSSSTSTKPRSTLLKQLRGTASPANLASAAVVALLLTIVLQLSKLPLPRAAAPRHPAPAIAPMGRAARRDWQQQRAPPPECARIFDKLRANALHCVGVGERRGGGERCDGAAGASTPAARRLKLGRVWMFSQFGQDAYLYVNHFRAMTRPGVYLDVASNHPKKLSNSYFFDRCLGWSGLCVEGNPLYYERTFRHRSCQLVPTCAGAVDGERVRFALRGELGGVLGESYKFGTNQSSSTGVMEQRCVSVQALLQRHALRRVQLLSLDVEGHEHAVLRGVDWRAVQIDIISVEVTKSFDDVHALLTRVGYVRHRVPPPHSDGSPVGPSFLGMDAIYVHPNVRFGHPQ